MTKQFGELLQDYDTAILDVVKAMIGDEAGRDSKVNAAKTRLAKARKDLSFQLDTTKGLASIGAEGFL